MRHWKLDAGCWKFCLGLFLFFSLQFPASSFAGNILITHDACVGTAATPAPDVAYKPGVDAGGNAVPPADLPGSAPAIQPPEAIQIPLQLNLQNALHIPHNSNLTSPEAIAGTIEYKNGQVTFNGQPVSADAAAQIQAACDASKPSGSASQPPGPALGTHSKNLLMGQ